MRSYSDAEIQALGYMHCTTPWKDRRPFPPSDHLHVFDSGVWSHQMDGQPGIYIGCSCGLCIYLPDGVL